jgi:hypothetical protein
MSTTPWQQRLALIGNSALAYSLGYASAYFVNELGLALAGAFAGLRPTLYHNTMHYEGFGGGSHAAFLGGIVLGGLTAVVTSALYLRTRDRRAGTLTLLWIALHGWRLTFAQFATWDALVASAGYAQ